MKTFIFTFIFSDSSLLLSHDWFFSICRRDHRTRFLQKHSRPPQHGVKTFSVMLILWITSRFWVSSASLWMLWTSLSPCDIITPRRSLMLSRIFCSVALGLQRVMVARVVKPLTFWASCKADGVSLSRRPERRRVRFHKFSACIYFDARWARYLEG